jgi:hypothetical protein
VKPEGWRQTASSSKSMSVQLAVSVDWRIRMRATYFSGFI